MTASRRVLRITLMLAVLAAPFAVEGQTVGKLYRIGFLWDSPGVFPDAIEAFRQGVRETATALGLRIRPDVLTRADEIIE